eukprot:TRINITY_DN19185_c0_g1_i1.p1 TRINITY_DN19185_c0_g1~~TRINITY_DN19185_c0_g1_i1.p1  ORF type:complete len:315 (-),score=48.06 TRINITY_DN19185_c0_g1_i1:662-1606(-)
MAALDDDFEASEHTLLVVREVNVYKIPPRPTSGGYKCAEWLVGDKIWTGRLRVVSLKDRCEIRLEDPNNGELFAACPVLPGKREATVENVSDSSRYFVLRIEDGRGHHAFIGLGFNERNEAFDFNVALSDHQKWAAREEESAANLEELQAGGGGGGSTSGADFRLKEGQTIHINVKSKLAPASGTGLISSGGGSTHKLTLSGGSGGKGMPLVPPPQGGRLRSPLPPPPGDTSRPAAARTSFSASGGTGFGTTPSQSDSDFGRPTGDPFADLSQLGLALGPDGGKGSSSVAPPPSSNTSIPKATTKTPAAGWAAF